MKGKRDIINKVQNEVRSPYKTCVMRLKLLGIMPGIILCLAGCAGETDATVGVREKEAEMSTDADKDMPVGSDAPAGNDALAADVQQGSDETAADPEDPEAEAQDVREDAETDYVMREYDVGVPDEDIPALENLYSYEQAESGDYMVITGIAEEYSINSASFWTIMSKLRHNYKDMEQTYYMVMPSEIDGLPVKEIADNAFFQDMYVSVHTVEIPNTVEKIGKEAFMNWQVERVILSENLETIGESAFENATLFAVQFPEGPMVIEKRAFAGDKGLEMVLIPNGETVLGEDVFADGDEGFLLCYGIRPDEKENAVAAYAEENGIDSEGILYSTEPIIHFHEEALTLTPEIGNFFYGEDADYESEKWCSWEEDENAPNFGFSEWQWPGCSSWCSVMDFEQHAVASSELPSGTGRYGAENVLSQNRDLAWAEGVEGPGIGESITYYQTCDVYSNDVMRNIALLRELPEDDGFMHYTEICIVNGYARDRKTWEENGRIKRLIMYIDDKPYAYLELEDTILPQYFSLPEDDIMVMNRHVLTVRFEIAEVYPGTLYEDTCLTGLVMEFSGRHDH